MKKILIILSLFLFISPTFVKGQKPVAQKVNDLKSKRVNFKEVSLFETNSSTRQQGEKLAGVVSDATILEFNRLAVSNLLLSRPEYIRLTISLNTGLPLDLDLFQSDIFTGDFSVTSSSTSGQPVGYSGGLHYWGIISGNNSSIAAISIFDEEVMGMISSPGLGNLVLGKLEDDQHFRHILYRDANLLVKPDIKCFTPEDDAVIRSGDTQFQNKAMVNCLRLFWEVNYDIYQNKGSVTNAVNYVTGLFNQSAIIYTNDGIPVELSEVYVWNTPSPYTASTTSAQLALFKSTRNSINGDLGHLLGLAGGGGIAAGFNGICNANLDNSQCYSMVYTSFSNVPAYSWSVMVVTHEQGHLMGSRHTHACVWNGNNTAIDNCGPTAGYSYEGGCNNAPTPVGGGTIMSYCHLVGSVGINFSNGFGPQPSALIINKYNNGACLTACIGSACMPAASMSVTNVANTTATMNWNPVTGASGYSIRFRITGNATWTVDTTSLTTYNATGLSPGSNYEWQVQTICAGSSSIYTISSNFITVPLFCLSPGGTTTTNIFSTSATFNWTAVSGATGYSLRYRIVGAANWTTVATVNTSYSVSGLTASTDYEWQVGSTCSGGGISSYSSSVLFTTTAPPCTPPQNIYTTNITSTSATFNWGTVSGATGYYIRHRIVGLTTWINNFDSVSPFISTGLTPSTNYEWQIMISCTGGQSAWSNSVMFTTLCVVPFATISANGPLDFCSGNMVLLTASSGIGYTYQWYKNGSLLSGMVSMNYPANTSGSYSVVVTSGSCSDTSSAMVVTVFPLPSVSSYDISGCDGTPVNLTGSPAGGTFSLSNPYSGPSTSYTYSFTDSNGCSNTSLPSVITIHPIPVVSFNGLDTTYLQTAGPVILTGNPAGGTFSGPGITGNSFIPSMAGPGGPYTITYNFTDSNNCFASSSQTTIVTPCTLPAQPGAISVVNGTSKVCPGDIRTYRVNKVTGITYTWIPPAGALILNGQGTNKVDISYTAGFTANGQISVTAGNLCGSGNARTLNVNMNMPGVPASIIGPDYGVCGLSNVVYATTAVNGMSYSWSFNVPEAGISSGQGNASVTAVFQGTFVTGQISVTASNTCGVSNPKQLTVNAVPAKPGVISGTNNVCANQQGVPYSITPVPYATSYKWTAPAGARISDGVVTSTIASLVTTATSVTINFKTTPGNVTVKPNNVCGYGASRSLGVTMPCKLGSMDIVSVNVFPNPSSGYFIIDLEGTISDFVTINIYDAMGQLVISEETRSDSFEINGENMSAGIYLAVISDGNFKKQIKLIKSVE